MSKKLDINIKEVEVHQSSGLDASWLTLELSGKDLNVKLVNALRRVCTEALPAYAFCPELIKIDANTMVAFNNDYMRNRLSFLPVLGAKPEIFFLPEKYWHKVNYADPKRDKHSTEQMVEAYINVHNNSATVVPVTTNDIKMYVDGTQIHPYSTKYPILISKLRPNDRFKCYMRAALGVGDNNAMWNSSRNAFYDYDDTLTGPDEKKRTYTLTIEGNWQLHEYEILLHGAKFLIKKMDDLHTYLKKKFDTKEILPDKVILLNLDREDHTVGEILNYELQDHPDIVASGVSKPDHLIKAILIKVFPDPTKKNPLLAILECVNIVKNKCMEIEKNILALGKKYLKGDILSYELINPNRVVDIKKGGNSSEEDDDSEDDDSEEDDSDEDAKNVKNVKDVKNVKKVKKANKVNKTPSARQKVKIPDEELPKKIKGKNKRG